MHVKLKNKKNISIWLFLILLIVSLNIFFGNIVNMKVAYPLIIIFQCIYIIKKRNLKLKRNQIISILLIFVYSTIQLSLAPFSLAQDISTYDAFLRFLTMIIGALFYLYGDWYQHGTKLFFIFSSVHTIFTIISYLLPNFFSTFVLDNISHDLQKEILRWKAEGVYSGISDQVGINAFFITVGLSIVYSKLICSNKQEQKKYFVILFVYLLALLLTGKRGHSIANLVVIFIIYIYKAKLNDKKIFKRLIKIMFITFIVLITIISVFPEASAPIQRFYYRNETGDITTGRIGLYSYAIKMFIEKPFLGWGTGAFKVVHSSSTHVHNIYLQLMAENGIIGFLLFISLLSINLTQTLKVIRRTNKNKMSSMFYLTVSLYFQLFFIIYGITGNPISDNYILLLYLISSSIPFSLGKASKIEKEIV